MLGGFGISPLSYHTADEHNILIGDTAPPMAKRSSYQQKVIKRYYKNRDAIMVQRLGELVSDLYLAEGKARQRVWKRVVAAMQKLEVPPPRIEKLVGSDNPTLVANLVKELME